MPIGLYVLQQIKRHSDEPRNDAGWRKIKEMKRYENKRENIE